MGKHAKLCPPSGWDRWSNCSASVDLQTNEGSEFAAQGTAAHLLADTCLRELMASWRDSTVVPLKPADFIGQSIWVPDAQDEEAGEVEHLLQEGEEAPLTGWVFEVDQEMVDNVQQYIDEVTMQERDYLQSETAVPLDHITGEEGASGHCDALRAHGKTLASHDLKYGKGVKVYAKENGQQLLYLLGGIRELEWLNDFEKFEIHIHQPRLGHHDVWYLSKEELEIWAKKIAAKAYDVVKLGKREFGPTVKGCKFCDNRRTCAARDEMAMANVDDFPDEGDAISGADPGQYMAAVLDRIEFVESWVKDMWTKANDMAKDQPGSIPGWDLFPGRGGRKIVDEAKVKARLRKRKHKLDEYMPRKMISAAQLEKLVGRDEYKKVFAEFVEHYEGSPKLGRVKGDRKTSAQADLDAFD